MRSIIHVCVLGLAACTGVVNDRSAEGRDGSQGALARDGGLSGTPDAAVRSSDPASPDGGRMAAVDAAAARLDATAVAVDAGTARVDAGAAAGDAATTVDAAADAGGADAGGADAGGADAGNGPPAVRFVGRVDSSDAAGPRFAWSGTGVVARFMGTSVAVKLAGGQEYTALLDGALLPKLVPGSGDTTIASGLSAGPHMIELYRGTEANQGESQFQGFTFGGGGMLLSAPPGPMRRLEIIGDSITCGFGIEGADETCSFTPQTENDYLTYGAIAARSLGADLNTIAWSGLGMVCNYGDDAQSCTNPLPYYYDRTLPNRTDSPWDFSSYQPQAVIINLGTNDFSTTQDPSEAEFTTAYTTFLLHLRSKYPDALILCTCGPLLYGTELDMVRRYIVNAVAATGDGNMTTFDIPSQTAADGLGCSYHPSIKTHQKMADLVVAELRSALGW